jgi:DNA polymerase elongation subunit (family B)
MQFYTSVIQRGDNILYRGYDNGKLVQKKIRYKPYFFVESSKPSKYKTLQDVSVHKMDFDSIGDAKEFVETHEGVSNFTIHGQSPRSFNYLWIYDNYRSDITINVDFIKTVYLDIEVASDDGFPKPEFADKEVTAIGMKFKGNKIVFGCGSYSANDDVKYIKCRDEAHLLDSFLRAWRVMDPDIITGWNVESFDVAYLINRINKILGENEAKRLSPWNIIVEKTVSHGKANGAFVAYDILGIAILDYLQLYKKFTYSNQESYKLDHIAMVELGEKKLDYSEYGNLYELYRNNYQMFIDYNIKDVELVERLEDKLKLIELVFAMAYSAKVNYVDTFGVVKLWDIVSHNFLLDRNIVVTPKESIPDIPYAMLNSPENLMNDSMEEGSFTGAYVKVPQVGMHEWVCSFDLNSLYPHLIMQYNISPETYVEQVPGQKDVDTFLQGDADNWNTDLIKTANRCLFRRDKQGFLPELMELYYNKRTIYKKKMIEVQKEYQKNKSYELEKEIARYNNLQMAFKIMLNSAYGALGNSHFRYYQIALAECITLSGQVSIRWIENEMNRYLNKVLKTDKDYIIASDTDSIYINFSGLVDKVFEGKEKETTKVVDYLNRVCEQKLEPFIDECYGHLAVYTNAYAQKMKMKRESIADKGIWTAKKRYILNVYDSEGVRYAEPKLKMMGIEAIKSSTPLACRESIKKALKIMMTENNQVLIQFVENFRQKFSKMPFEEIAFPRGCNNLAKYSNDDLVYSKGTPIHVKGALWYNRLIKKKNLAKRYPYISEGEKVKFCYLMRNKYGITVISSPAELPKELDIEQFIDYDTQFNKAFIEPLNAIAEKINWTTKQNTATTLDDFFS